MKPIEVINYSLFQEIIAKFQFGNKEIEAVCGHLTKKYFSISGPREERRLYLINESVIPFCPNCLVDFGIYCANCRGPIFPYEEITPWYEADTKIFYSPELFPEALYPRFPKALGRHAVPIGCKRCARNHRVVCEWLWTPGGIKPLSKAKKHYDMEFYHIQIPTTT